jgi:hypothetical protein
LVAVDHRRRESDLLRADREQAAEYQLNPCAGSRGPTAHLARTIARYGRVDLLCIDELGYMELDRRGAELWQGHA